MRFFKPPTNDRDQADVTDQSSTPVNKESQVSNVQDSLSKMMDSVDGAIGVALVEFDGGLTLGTAGGNSEFDVDIAGAGNLEVVRTIARVMGQLGIEDEVEDILITLGQQYHLIRPVDEERSIFLYLAIDRQQGNLGLARHQMRRLGADLVL